MLSLIYIKGRQTFSGHRPNLKNEKYHEYKIINNNKNPINNQLSLKNFWYTKLNFSL